MVGEARGHRLWRREHMRVVAATQRLGGVERRVLADRDEDVLQQRALGRVGVDVAGRDRRDAEPLGEPRQPAVQRAVVAGERALQLDAQVLATEDVQEAAHRRLVADATGRAAAEADEAVRDAARRRRARRRAPMRSRCGPSRVCACAFVSSRQRLRQPVSSRTSSVMWRSSSSVTSAPWIARSPSVFAACANSIEPDSES